MYNCAQHPVVRSSIGNHANLVYQCVRFFLNAPLAYVACDGTNMNARPSLLAVLVMLVVYRTGGNNQSEFNEISMSNLQSESNR